jgi:uncharacterized protein (DUF983 family)
MSGPSEPTPLAAALAGACPRCGERSLFAGPTRFADKCSGCGLDFESFNVGDGPAAFLILIIGAVLVIAAISVEIMFQAPFAVHLVWIPVGVAMTVLGLRFGKAFLLAQEYRHQAREGRLQ